MREGALRSLNARSIMLDGLYRSVFREPGAVGGGPFTRLPESKCRNFPR